MNRKKLKQGLISVGIGLIISAPISGAAMESWENPPRMETESVSDDLSGLQDDFKELASQQEQLAEEIAREQSRIALVLAEYERQQEIENDARTTLEIYGVELPEDIQVYSERAQDESNVCAELLEALCWKESRFNPQASNDGCEGIAQISTKWHKGRMKKLGVTNIYDAEGNIRVAADYLKDLFEKYDGDVYKALMEYNGDTSEGVSDYALEICAVSEALERVHGK